MGLKTPGLASCLNNAFRLRDSILRSIKFFEDRLARAQKENSAKERDNRQKTRPEPMLPNLAPPHDLLEEAIRTDLLPRMTTASAQPPAHRPMSNRKNNWPVWQPGKIKPARRQCQWWPWPEIQGDGSRIIMSDRHYRNQCAQCFDSRCHRLVSNNHNIYDEYTCYLFSEIYVMCVDFPV